MREEGYPGNLGLLVMTVINSKNGLLGGRAVTRGASDEIR